MHALDAARASRMSLYIQPLGIGAYGWPPELAADLFSAAIEKVALAGNSEKFPDIYIPIFDHKNKQSKDCLFSFRLVAKLKKLQINIDNQLEMKETDEKNPSSPEPQSGLKTEASRAHFVLKCLAYLCMGCSTALLICAALIVTVATFGTSTSLIFGAAGVAMGISSYFLFKAARAQENNAPNSQNGLNL